MKLFVELPGGVRIKLRRNPHNEVLKEVGESFLSRFVPGAEVLYVGDAGRKVVFNKARLTELRLSELADDHPPDLVVYDPARAWVYFVEVAHSSDPLTPLRHVQLEKLAKDCTAGVVYVSAFADRKMLARWLPEISWETEVWLAESPDHMIHFDGDRFPGPRGRRGGSRLARLDSGQEPF